MKKLSFYLITAATFFSVAGCGSTDPEQILKKADTRRQIISTLIKNADYHKEMMDSMMIQMGTTEMMNKMMSGGSMMQMMKTDTAMHNSMMKQMMTMANEDSMICNKMMSMMKDHPNIKKQMEKKAEMKELEGHENHH